ncbi:MAG TPA: hypothetical protein VG267_13205 [Terracidiphilus sp.]|jgi:hypothetical protein|nr:hypothetical protein [Terracidiphilus sp.]
MRKVFASVCVFAGCVVLLPLSLTGQEVIHALTGTVSAINPATKTITVFQDNGSRGVFQEMVNKKTAIAFDKKIAAETIAATAFDKEGSYAIVFYYGDNDDQTVVAVKSLGAGPFASVTGTVTKFDPHAHSISVQEASGTEHTFRIDASTVAEGGGGAIPGLKFQAQHGDRVRVVCSGAGSAETALFVRQM